MKICLLLVWFVLATSAIRAEVSTEAWRALDQRFLLAQKDFRGQKSASRIEHLAYLRSLLLYESAVRLMAQPIDEPVGLERFRDFSTSERRSIAALRQEIREQEQERLVIALLGDEDLSGDEKKASAILKNELRLDSFFQKRTRKQEAEISKLERELGKIQSGLVHDEAARDSVKAEIAALRVHITAIHDAVYGFAGRAGFRQPVGPDVTGDAAALLALIVAEREEILAYLKEERTLNKDEDGKAGMIGGAFLYSSNLGIVLDVSGSMTAHLEELRGQINSYFEAPKYREVVGCRLDSCHREHLRTTRQSETWATLSVIEELVTVEEVDTVYWFSDLKDNQSMSSLRRLRELLMKGGARLYVKSLGEKPNRFLDSIITDFKG